MSPTAQRLAIATLNGFVWYRYIIVHSTREGCEPEITWDTVLRLPPEEGIAAPIWKGRAAETRHWEQLAQTRAGEVERLVTALRAIRALKPTNMACDYWSTSMGLEPDDVFDLVDAALETAS